jgi:FtsP/CotA-like multicopper oxidase with cupredoxin domain
VFKKETSMRRREFLSLSAVTSLWLLNGCGGSSSSSGTTTVVDKESTGLITGEPLAIPTLLDPMPVNGIKSFDLTIAESTHKFFHEFDTKTAGINASYLGPTLLLRNGEQVSLNFQNTLTESTTMHGHGMHVPASMDGGPHQLIAAGATWSAAYTVKQKACLNWYHPHQMGKTAEHVYQGLAGLIIVEDDESEVLALPKNYGEDDIPLVIQDRVFDAAGQFDYTPTNQDIMRGYRGDTIITNGQIAPIFNAKLGLLRIRLLNGSNAGLYRFSFSDNRQFYQISVDNSFLEQPVALTSVLISPGERCEIIVDLAGDSGATLNLNVLEEIDQRNKTVLVLNVGNEVAAITSLPTALTTLEVVDESLAVNTRTFLLAGRGNGGNPELTINGVAMNMAVINETVPLNQVEIWEITNNMNMPHNFHIHATHFRAIDRNGSATQVADNEKGYKDTMLIPANETVRLLVKMVDYSDANGKYMYHCHFLEHEDAGMMGQFVVINS